MPFNGSIPSAIWSLESLQTIYLDDNQLASISPEISNLVNLQWLSIRGSQLKGVLPPEIGKLVNLHALYLNYNQLAGTIPAEIGNLVDLENFD